MTTWPQRSCFMCAFFADMIDETHLMNLNRWLSGLQRLCPALSHYRLDGDGENGEGKTVMWKLIVFNTLGHPCRKLTRIVNVKERLRQTSNCTSELRESICHSRDNQMLKIYVMALSKEVMHTLGTV